MSHRRIACLMVAGFPVAAAIRANPELRERPFALLRLPTAASPAGGAHRAHRAGIATYQPHSEIAHVSPLAKAAGLRPGMTVAQARALLPGLVITSPSAAAERAAADALLNVAESLSPVVEEGAPGCVWLDLTGIGRFFRHSMRAGATAPPMSSVSSVPDTHISASSNALSAAGGGAVEDEIAAELIRRARQIGLETAAGIAAGKEIAHLAARCGGIRVIAPGREREFLDWMPLDLLDLDHGGASSGLELAFARLGMRRLGDLARLDVRAVGSRLGARGVELVRLARGESSSAPVARPRAESFAEAAELEYGIENLEALGFVMHAMLARLAARLSLRGLVAGDMALALGLAGHRHDDRRVVVAAPTNDVRSLLTLLNLNLAALPPPAAIESIRLTVAPRTPRPAQTDMFLPPAPAPDRLETAMARIAAICGPDHLGTLVQANSWRPEAMRLGPFAPPPPPPLVAPDRNGASHPPAANANVSRMVMRTIRPAEEVEVMCQREAPEFVRGKTICARVITTAGPWRRQGEWWRPRHPMSAGHRARGAENRWDTLDDGDEIAVIKDPKDGESADAAPDAAHASGNDHAGAWNAAAPMAYARDYYELALTDGGVYRVYCDLYSGRWFVDGIYD
ncbi:MAG: DNA polymerase Y family protein [Candidatus Binataceae bacterium]